MSLASGVVRVRLLGRKPDQWRPQWYLCSLGLERVPSRSKAEPWFGSRGCNPRKLQRICILQYLKLGLKLIQNTWMVMHFSCALQYKVTGKFQKVQNFEFLNFLSEKMCMFIFLAGQFFANYKSKQRVTDQCQDRPYTLQHLIKFSKKCFYPSQFHGHSVS